MKRDGKPAIDKLIDALIRMMKVKEYSLITVSDICREAGVSRMAFYRGFSSKEDVIDKFINRIADEIHRNLAKQKEFNVKKYFSQIFSEVEKYQELIVCAMASNIHSLILNSFDRLMSSTFKEKDSNTHSYRPHMIAGAVYNVLVCWIMNGRRETPEEMADICCQIAGVND